MTREEIIAEYNNVEKQYNEVVYDDNYINNMLSKFIINGSPIGSNNTASYLPYSAGYNSNMDISLPGNSSEYQQAIDAIDSNNSMISSLVDRGIALINECSQKLQDSICSSISSATEIIVDRLNSMKSEREETRSLLSTISQRLNEYVDSTKGFDVGSGVHLSGTFGGSGGGDFIQNDGSSSASTTGSSPTFSNNGYGSNTSKSYLNAGMSNVNKARSIDSKVASNAESIASRLSNIVYGEPPKCPGGSAYPLATPKEGASLNIPSPEEIASIFQEISNDIADMQSEIQALEEANAALEQVPEEIIVGYDDDGNPIWGPNPDYAVAQAQIAENNAKIAALNARISECQAVQNELTDLLNTVYKVNADQMQLSFAADVIKQYDETGVINYAGRTLSGLEAANLYNNMMEGLKNVDKLALFDDTNGATKPEGYTGMTMSEYDNLMATAASQQKALDFEAWTELNGIENRSAAQEKMYQEYSNRIMDTMGNNPDSRYLTKGNIDIYERLREESGNPLTKEERDKLEASSSNQDKSDKNSGKDEKKPDEVRTPLTQAEYDEMIAKIMEQVPDAGSFRSKILDNIDDLSDYDRQYKEMSEGHYENTTPAARFLYTYDKFREHGFSEWGAKAAMAQMYGTTYGSMDPTTNQRAADGTICGPAYGISQLEWKDYVYYDANGNELHQYGCGEADIAKAWCDDHGYDFDTIDGQVAYLAEEGIKSRGEAYGMPGLDEKFRTATEDDYLGLVQNYGVVIQGSQGDQYKNENRANDGNMRYTLWPLLSGHDSFKQGIQFTRV